MNKKILALLLIAALAVSALALTACSAKEEEPTEAVTTVAAVEETPTELAEAPVATDAPAAPASNLEELVAQQNAALEAANAAAGGQYKIEVKADGDKLVYSYTYAMELPAQALQASLDAAGQSYGGQISTLKGTGYDISAIVIQFLDQNGKELASKEFK